MSESTASEVTSCVCVLPLAPFECKRLYVCPAKRKEANV